jgi:hypothetical protein
MRRLLVVFAAVAVSVPASSGSAATTTCERSGSVTVARSPEVRVYKRHRDRHPGGTRVESTYACLAASGRTVRLDQPRADASFAYPPPGLRVAGSVVAYGIDVIGEFPSGDDTNVAVLDMAGNGAPPSATGFDAYRAGAGHVGSVAVTPAGGVAWIACPPTSGRAEGSARPNCVKPGRSGKRVFKVEAGTSDVVKLDSGRAIDPRSIRVADGQVTWRHGADVRTAPLR